MPGTAETQWPRGGLCTTHRVRPRLGGWALVSEGPGGHSELFVEYWTNRYCVCKSFILSTVLSVLWNHLHIALIFHCFLFQVVSSEFPVFKNAMCREPIKSIKHMRSSSNRIEQQSTHLSETAKICSGTLLPYFSEQIKQQTCFSTKRKN